MPIKKVDIKEWEKLGLPKETNFINFDQHISILKNKISKKKSTPNNSKSKKNLKDI